MSSHPSSVFQVNQQFADFVTCYKLQIYRFHNYISHWTQRRLVNTGNRFSKCWPNINEHVLCRRVALTQNLHSTINLCCSYFDRHQQLRSICYYHERNVPSYKSWIWGFWHWARFLSLARSKLRLCSANHRTGYFNNLACDCPRTVWAYSEQAAENGPWPIVNAVSLSIRPFWASFNGSFFLIETFSLKLHLKWWPFCLGHNAFY